MTGLFISLAICAVFVEYKHLCFFAQRRPASRVYRAHRRVYAQRVFVQCCSYMQWPRTVGNQPVAVCYKRDKLIQAHAAGNVRNLIAHSIKYGLYKLPLFFRAGNEYLKTVFIELANKRNEIIAAPFTRTSLRFRVQDKVVFFFADER